MPIYYENSGGGGGGSTSPFTYVTGSTQTVGAVTDGICMTTVPAGTTYQVTGIVKAWTTNLVDHAGYEFKATVFRNLAGCFIQGLETIAHTQESDVGFDATIDTDGVSQFGIKVSGVGGKTIEWRAVLEIF